ncbi:Fatty-acid amide hydrolase 2 [Pseudolycoriella hygida]|uniref:Fatty-acid amide hydrolase 2 n=1 Tax=Pseudolycoriella hygida TaxID=35572 RepID=A0A9Q0MU84_9DIPT|nr:Fatty-acid amide hydrolase 2 [Pseudolycoriella hygida]
MLYSPIQIPPIKNELLKIPAVELAAKIRMSYSVGSLTREGVKSTKDGDTIGHLRAAGGIPLLVSNTPEFCTSWETSNLITGRTLNPYNSRITPGGSSGGEGALIGAGASLFGIGSDIAGSIRVPAMFNGIFGHKPTGGVVSVNGHFPYSTDDAFQKYLVIGPMCRYAKDLPTLVHIMSGSNASKLRLDEQLYTKDIKIFYMEDAGFSFIDVPVENSIKIAMWKALNHFKSNSLQVMPAPIKSLQESMEIGLVKMFEIPDIPIILKHPQNPQMEDSLYMELAKSLFGKSKYSFAGLFFCVLIRTNGFISKSKNVHYNEKLEDLRRHFLSFLGDNGVMFYPTYPITALRHCDSFAKIAGVMYTMIFNILGFPATHVPLGKDSDGIPIGIQVVAAPYQDRLCLCIAAELEAAFGGWVPPF